ncbi:diguanylate cyclase [Hydrogenovibrio kuenenii]|uniref:diguanylate cyclase n=1 Tax=Hydrogenovibrio kuenenii TaxID=63658 RepID=UPI0004664A44|nr:diguanylate cyclase [Hydrogenovibrio kuenenii]
MHSVSKQELQDTLQQLNQAIYNHDQWSKDLIRSMICRLPYDNRDIADDAHHHCRFGQWYYGAPPQAFLEHPAFKAIGTEHRRMHQVTAQLLLESASKGSVNPLDYDNFVSATERLRLEIYSFKHEIEESLNTRDPLTGAENRFNMLSRLRELNELSKRGIQDSSIAIMDLDYFKKVNDTYGHAAGDQVLVAWVNYIRKNLRKYDRIYRYGGEEFLLSFPGNGQQSVKELIERLRNGMPEITIEGGETKSIVVTASFGIATLDPSLNVEESINRADTALYAAKKAGRNCSCIWDSTMAPMQNAGEGHLSAISGEINESH